MLIQRKAHIVIILLLEATSPIAYERRFPFPREIEKVDNKKGGQKVVEGIATTNIEQLKNQIPQKVIGGSS